MFIRDGDKRWYLSPDEGGGGRGDADPGKTDPNVGGDPAEGKGDTKPEPKPLSMSQAELDVLIGREKAKAKKAAKDEFDEEARNKDMTDAERLKSEKDTAEKKLTETTDSANARIIRAEAKLLAVTLGVKAERADTVIKLADLSAVTLDDNGDIDLVAIKKALEIVKMSVPELFAPAMPKKGGGDLNGDPGNQGSVDAQLAEIDAKLLAGNLSYQDRQKLISQGHDLKAQKYSKMSLPDVKPEGQT